MKNMTKFMGILNAFLGGANIVFATYKSFHGDMNGALINMIYASISLIIAWWVID